ncbi:MAG TPA: hypothetical protein VLT35_03350 [Methanocella sp.]|nr:hypothetical protein [Methanocella sp.]
MRRPAVPPWLALLLVSPATGEVLSGSTPPRELLDPIGWAFLLGLYGGGALLARETAFRWRRGWPSIVALGFFVVLSLLQTAGDRADMGQAGSTAAILLYVLWRRLESRTKPLNAPAWNKVNI